MDLTPLRYVILRHENIPEPHYDLMFETAPNSPLLTWRSPSWPINKPTPLLRLPDHRSTYLDYEGPISGDRGSVVRVERGQHTFSIIGRRWQIFMDPSASSLLLIRGEDLAWLAQPDTEAK